jgi:hypothetical protein
LNCIIQTRYIHIPKGPSPFDMNCCVDILDNYTNQASKQLHISNK